MFSEVCCQCGSWYGEPTGAAWIASESAANESEERMRFKRCDSGNKIDGCREG